MRNIKTVIKYKRMGYYGGYWTYSIEYPEPNPLEKCKSVVNYNKSKFRR